jgi:hypothetical protein
MGISQSTIKKIGFEDVQIVVKNSESYLLINTLPKTEQLCLILNTISINQEEELINKYIGTNKHVKIVIYGKNSTDESVFTKHQQLVSLGFINIFIYMGGLFEWLLLQDIYGLSEFATTNKQLDILKYKPKPFFNVHLIEN